VAFLFDTDAISESLKRQPLTPTAQSWNDVGDILARIVRREPALKTKVRGLWNDALIALSARQLGTTVMTGNIRDFGLLRRFTSASTSKRRPAVLEGQIHSAGRSEFSRKEPFMPRLAPVSDKSNVAPEHHAVVDAVQKVFGNVRGPFSMLLHSPKLAERILPLVTFFRDESVVDAKLRSVAILTAVREREAAYVWSAQVGAARRNGLREEVIDLLRAKGDPGKLPDEEREIVTYVRQLMRTNRVDQAAFDALKKRHDAQWMVELTAVANYFALLSGMVNAFEVTAPPDGDKLPA
jgi:4-carboxymuconolactone decarboxylase